MKNIRLQQQLDFIIEIDKLKHIYRETLLTDGSRNENDAEHSWHIAIMAILLCEHATDTDIDIFRVVKMLLIHDLVEIDAGDLFCYSEQDVQAHKAREAQAAERLFGMLPSNQAQEFRELWQEFEAQETPEACFAASIDRLQPLLHNYKTNGYSWKKHGVSSGKVWQRVQPIQKISPALWKLVEELIQSSVQKGYLHLN